MRYVCTGDPQRGWGDAAGEISDAEANDLRGTRLEPANGIPNRTLSPGDELVWVAPAILRDQAARHSVGEALAQRSAGSEGDLQIYLPMAVRAFPASAEEFFGPVLAMLIGVPAETVMIRVPVGEQDATVQTSCLWQWMFEKVRQGASFSTPTVEDVAAPAEERLRELAPPPPPTDHWLRAAIASIDLERIVDGAVRVETVAFRAGLYQWHDFLEESHSQSQSIEGAGRHRNGDYWHAIMHRREPDDGNSKYWFRRVGMHPIFENLTEAAVSFQSFENTPDVRGWLKRLTPDGAWDPFAFVDMCSEARRVGGMLAERARSLQMLEMQSLLLATFRDMGGD